MNLEEVMRCVPESVIVAVNIDPVEQMLRGNYESVRRAAEERLTAMRSCVNYGTAD